ncbi:MAG: FAD-binding protein [Chloroflexi bacterium]|nr:FAD-binding protein [Chloroflexota bacterium]
MTSIEELADEFIETDILIIGGGLAGKMAAIRAKEKGTGQRKKEMLMLL